MPLSKAQHLRNLKTAAFTGAIFPAIALLGRTLHFVLRNPSHQSCRTYWSVSFEVPAICGLALFVVSFLWATHSDWARLPQDAILSGETPPGTLLKVPHSGFVAMEYCNLIWNRTFLIVIAPEGLYGWKVTGAVTASNPAFYRPYQEIANDPEFMRDLDAIEKLSKLKGSFFIPRSSIASVKIVDKQKWGMGTILHTGRIRIELTGAKSREFILLGAVSPQSIYDRIVLA